MTIDWRTRRSNLMKRVFFVLLHVFQTTTIKSPALFLCGVHPTEQMFYALVEKEPKEYHTVYSFFFLLTALPVRTSSLALPLTFLTLVLRSFLALRASPANRPCSEHDSTMCANPGTMLMQLASHKKTCVAFALISCNESHPFREASICQVCTYIISLCGFWSHARNILVSRQNRASGEL
jgi:hypothetical protein